jgi:AraC-like DNA-binding protein
MIYRSYSPSPPLAEFVDRFWHCSEVPSFRRARILPSGTLQLVFNLCENQVRIYDSLESDRCLRYSGAIVSGPYGGSVMIDPMPRSSIIGVHFKPGGAFPFLGAPADELADMHLDLDALWGPTAAELRERLCAAATVDRRFSLLEAALLSRLRSAPRSHAAVPIALAKFDRTAGGASVRDVARHVGLSQRRFIRVFAAEVGLTPKLYCRVRRFQQAREHLRNVTTPDWAQVAVAVGYCDQSHLIRDFQALSGLTPANYFRQSSGQLLPNHALPS